MISIIWIMGHGSSNSETGISALFRTGVRLRVAERVIPGYG